MLYCLFVNRVCTKNSIGNEDMLSDLKHFKITFENRHQVTETTIKHRKRFLQYRTQAMINIYPFFGVCIWGSKEQRSESKSVNICFCSFPKMSRTELIQQIILNGTHPNNIRLNRMKSLFLQSKNRQYCQFHVCESIKICISYF